MPYLQDDGRKTVVGFTQVLPFGMSFGFPYNLYYFD
jgi:hypothetical protein